MKVYEMEQYSEAYWAIKLGKLSASQMDKIVSPTGKNSSSLKDYVFKKIAELETGEREETFESYHMKRGLALEPEAKRRFSFITGLEVVDVGVVVNAKYPYLCASPDGLDPNYNKFGLEIKCPMPGELLKTRYEKVIPTKNKAQVYSSLWLCDDVERWYFMSYHPEMEPFITFIDRTDPDYITYATALEARLPVVKHLISDIKKNDPEYIAYITTPESGFLSLENSHGV